MNRDDFISPFNLGEPAAAPFMTSDEVSLVNSGVGGGWA
jgi:hypothetical protein